MNKRDTSSSKNLSAGEPDRPDPTFGANRTSTAAAADRARFLLDERDAAFIPSCLKDAGDLKASSPNADDDNRFEYL
jgi:hypothetical protein